MVDRVREQMLAVLDEYEGGRLGSHDALDQILRLHDHVFFRPGAWVTATAAANIVGVSRQRVDQLAAADPDFPRGLDLGTGRAWLRTAVEEYARCRVRLSGGRGRGRSRATLTP